MLAASVLERQTPEIIEEPSARQVKQTELLGLIDSLLSPEEGITSVERGMHLPATGNGRPALGMEADKRYKKTSATIVVSVCSQGVRRITLIAKAGELFGRPLISYNQGNYGSDGSDKYDALQVQLDPYDVNASGIFGIRGDGIQELTGFNKDTANTPVELFAEICVRRGCLGPILREQEHLLAAARLLLSDAIEPVSVG